MGIYTALADVLDYPTPGLEPRIEACLALAQPEDPGWADLRQFRDTVSALTCGELQEAYTDAFDLAPDCALYVGYHLFGDDRRRVMFMCRLAELYRDAGFSVGGGEPPDYMVAMLRFVDGPGSAGERADLLADAVAPAAERAAGGLERRRHPYAPLLRAVAAMTRTARAATTPERAAV